MSLNSLNDLSKVYLDTVAKVHKEVEKSEVERWNGYLNKEEALQEKQKDTPDQVKAVIAYDKARKGTDDATYDSMHGKKKQAKKERDYAKFERDQGAEDAQKSGNRWKHAKGSTREKEGKKSEKHAYIKDSHAQQFGQLMDAYQTIYKEQKAETPAAEEEKMKKDDKLFGSPNKKKKKHDCASKVKHEQFGMGRCIPEMHDLDEHGRVVHYDVMFEHGVEKHVPVASLQILEGQMHEHVIHEKMAAKDYDGDGKVESGKDEYFGSKDKAIKKAMGKKSPESIEAKRRKDDDLAGSPLKKEGYVTELHKTTMGSYVSKASKNLADRRFDQGRSEKATYEPDKDDEKEEMKLRQREKGISTAAKKLSKEEVVPVDEKISASGYARAKKYREDQAREKNRRENPQQADFFREVDKIKAAKAKRKDKAEKNLASNMKKEGFSDWRSDLIEVSDTVGSGGVPLTDVQASKKVKEGKVNNKVVINPKLGEAIEQIGGELIEVHEDMEPNKKKKNCGCGQDPCVTYGKQDQLEVAMEKGKQAIGTLGATTKGTSYAEDKDWIQKAVKRPGAFTRKAKAAGMDVQQFAKNVDDNPGKYSTRTKKQANLAQTFASMKKEDVEELFYTLIVE